MLLDIIRKYIFDKNSDRLGPDIPFTHWRLYYKNQMIKLCTSKFYHFGERSEFRPGAYAINCSRISIGNDVIIRPGTMLFADLRTADPNIIIEDKVLIGSGVHFYVANHNYTMKEIPIFDQGHLEPCKIVIKTGSWIGANVIILPGIEVGENSVIGAGSIVTKSVPKNVLVAGNPARIISQL